MRSAAPRAEQSFPACQRENSFHLSSQPNPAPALCCHSVCICGQPGALVGSFFLPPPPPPSQQKAFAFRPLKLPIEPSVRLPNTDEASPAFPRLADREDAASLHTRYRHSRAFALTGYSVREPPLPASTFSRPRDVPRPPPHRAERPFTGCARAQRSVALSPR